MNRKYYTYLVRVQYLGFRFHGWQKQPNVKTLQEMIEKTFRYIFEKKPFKILGASRTDAMVSANHAAFELFMREPIDEAETLKAFNYNLPQDLRALELYEIKDPDFNIIQHSKQKEYVYLFSFGEKPHPFSAPFMTYVREPLDIGLMKKGAKLYEGTHNFLRFCKKPNGMTQLVRTIDECEIVPNELYQASFFPEESYLFRVKASGFLRNQIRLMVGALFDLGCGALTLEELETALKGETGEMISVIAPASGLILNEVEFEQSPNKELSVS
ncbi:MAG: tRNA pseudouridine(38-40) synthase TruA [Cytophagales bacterium]|nr:tRNA pseudouridine(38-40) synthase TruA [Cytophagales bacterium]